MLLTGIKDSTLATLLPEVLGAENSSCILRDTLYIFWDNITNKF